MSLPTALNIIATCWGAFLVIWLIAAGWTKASTYRETRSRRLRYTIFLIAAYVVLVYGGRLPYPLSLRVIPVHRGVELAGVILCLAGLVFSFWARFTIGRNWSGNITLKKEHKLVQHGPYRWVRHPIYTGLILMLFGTVLVLGRVAGLISLALALVSFWIKLQDEETLMLQHFPNQYPAYQQRVKCLIPFVW